MLRSRLSRMWGRAAGSRAPLGLLLVCLPLPGLFARSIGAGEEKANSPPLRQPPFTGLAASAQPQPKPGPGSTDVAGLPPKLSDSPQPAEGFEVQSWPPSWGPPPMEPWALAGDGGPGDPWQVMAALGIEDYLAQAPPEDLPYLSGAGAPPLRGSPPSAGSPARPKPPSREASGQLGAQGEIFAPNPLWSLIHRLLPGLPWGVLSPGAAWGGGRLGNGWGTRPMPSPSGTWGSNSQVPGASWGGGGRYPGTSWGGGGRYPGASWGGGGRYPGASWGGGGRYPGASWGGTGRYPGASWGGTGRYPGTSWGGTGRYPGASWGGGGRYPGASWGDGGRYPGGARPPGSSWSLPAGFANPQNQGLQWG